MNDPKQDNKSVRTSSSPLFNTLNPPVGYEKAILYLDNLSLVAGLADYLESFTAHESGGYSIETYTSDGNEEETGHMTETAELLQSINSWCEETEERNGSLMAKMGDEYHWLDAPYLMAALGDLFIHGNRINESDVTPFSIEDGFVVCYRAVRDEIIADHHLFIITPGSFWRLPPDVVAEAIATFNIEPLYYSVKINMAQFDPNEEEPDYDPDDHDDDDGPDD